MGRCFTPKYRVTINGRCGNFPRGTGIGPTVWDRHMGRPTSDNLAKALRGYQISTEPGGVNAHLGAEPLPESAEIIRQSDNKVVARFARPTVARIKRRTPAPGRGRPATWWLR